MKWTWIVIIALGVAFFIPCFLVIDPDFGWYIATGRYILSHGIPRTDPFSYTMPSYPFISHEWLATVVLAAFLPIIRYAGIALFFSLLVTLAFTLQFLCLPKIMRPFALVPITTAGVSLIAFTGIRLQGISWVLFSLLLWMIYRRTSRKGHWLFPLLFLIWANLHGSFSLGIIVFGLHLLTQSPMRKSVILNNGALFLVSLAATCITPYGVSLWSVIWTHLTSNTNYWFIGEWQSPLFSFADLIFLPCFWIYLTFSLAVVIFYRKKLNRQPLAIYTLLLLMSLISVRNIPFWLIASLLPTATAFSYLLQDIKKLNSLPNRPKATFLFSCLLAILCVVQLLIDNFPFYPSAQHYYPKQAINFLKQHPTSGQIFSIYAWGGYLDWQLPQKKVFIDGRMPTWNWKAPNTHEENNVLQTYIDLGYGKVRFKNLARKYRINTVLLPVGQKKKKSLWLSEGLYSQREADVEEQVKMYGMKKIYQDTVAVIYQRE